MSDKIRSFTIHESSVAVTGGRYKSNKPITVAKKVASMLFDIHMRRKKILFCIRETTKNSKKKLYYYEADNKKTDNKVKVYRAKGGEPEDKYYITTSKNNILNRKRYLGNDLQFHKYYSFYQQKKLRGIFTIKDENLYLNSSDKKQLLYLTHGKQKPYHVTIPYIFKQGNNNYGQKFSVQDSFLKFKCHWNGDKTKLVEYYLYLDHNKEIFGIEEHKEGLNYIIVEKIPSNSLLDINPPISHMSRNMNTKQRELQLRQFTDKDFEEIGTFNSEWENQYINKYTKKKENNNSSALRYPKMENHPNSPNIL